MIRWIINALTSPLIRLGERYIEAQTDREKLRAGVEKVALSADAAVRRAKLGYLLGRVPLFIAEAATSMYIAAVLLDSAFPSDWLNPLELPKWFQPHFGLAVASVFGLAAAERFLTRRQ